MKNLILEEVNRINYLSNYNTLLTSKENKGFVIIEGPAWLKDALMADKDVISAFKGEGALLSKLNVQVKEYGKFKTLTNPNDILLAIRDGKLSLKELARINSTLFKDTKNVKLSNILAKSR